MGGEGNRGRKGMRKKGMRKAVAVINSAFFLYLNSFHLSRNLLPLDQVCISHSLVPSRPVPSRPVPSRPVFFHYPFFSSSLHAFSISPHLLSSRPSLSFPFLSFYSSTPSRSSSALLSPTPASSHSRFDTRFQLSLQTAGAR